MERTRVMRMAASLIVTLGIAAPAAAQSVAVDLAGEGWQLEGEGTRIEQFQGRTVLAAVNGYALLPDFDFQDGVIEFDLHSSGVRSFAFLAFRMGPDDGREEVYLRPHNSDLPDALQYTPVYAGASTWQLFHGPGATAAATLPADRWIPVRLVVEGRRAALFVGDVAEPQLVVPRLDREPRSGGIALLSSIPGADAATSPTRFSNLRVRRGTPPPELAAALRSETDLRAYGAGPGETLRRWEISAVFDGDTTTVLDLPSGLDDAGWTPVTADAAGRVLFARETVIPDGLRRRAVAARVVLEAEVPGVRRLDFGFSDFVSVFLNGRLLYSGDNSYSYDAPRRLGLITLDQASLYLPLETGRNEVVFVVSEVFGGWGLMARLEDRDGLRLAD